MSREVKNVAPVVILGGGLCGLSTALHLSEAGVNWLLLEREDRVGGHARTDETRGFHFDKTGHWLHLRDPGIQKLVGELLPGELTRVERKARIFSHGVLTRYPFQANLHGLPPSIIAECLIEFLRAAERRKSASAPANFEEFCQQSFGAGISRHFMIPYNQKLWGRTRARSPASGARASCPSPSSRTWSAGPSAMCRRRWATTSRSSTRARAASRP